MALDDIWFNDSETLDEDECIWDDGNVTWLCREANGNDVAGKCNDMLDTGSVEWCLLNDVLEDWNYVS